MKTNKTISRRSALQNISLTALGLSLLPFATNAQANSVTNNPSQLEPFYLPPQSPLQPGPGGIDIRTWVRSTQTNNQFSCVEAAVAPKKMGPEPHYHKELDEIMFVLEGTATVMVNGEVQEIPQGGMHLRPRNMEHTFWNNSDKPLRFLDLYFNQNFEEFLEEIFHKIFPEMVANKLTPTDPSIIKKMTDLNDKFGIVSFPEKRQAIIDKYGLLP
jgi:mannose-6-phosphate isomerase-like protein (cupin superfamily)